MNTQRVREIALTGGCGELAARILDRVGGIPLIRYDCGSAVHAAVRLTSNEIFDIGDGSILSFVEVSRSELDRARHEDFDPDRVNIQPGELDEIMKFCGLTE